MDRQRVSFTMGQRLKDLREGCDLSHVDLIKQLSEKYGISISRDSLMAYEIADQTRAKASKLPNLGMRVEYLYCLADFFGVSIDYLLGKTDIKSVDANLQSVCGYTGLSECAIKNICFAHEVEHETEHDISATRTKIAFKGSFFVNKFFESPEFYKALRYVFRAVYADSMKYKPVPLFREKESKTQEERDLIDEFDKMEVMATELSENHGKVLLEGSEAAEYFVLKAKETVNQIIDDIFSLSVEELDDILSPLIPQ